MSIVATIITIQDYGRPEYLDGAQMQYALQRGNEIIAFVEHREDALKMAEALGYCVIWYTP